MEIVAFLLCRFWHGLWLDVCQERTTLNMQDVCWAKEHAQKVSGENCKACATKVNFAVYLDSAVVKTTRLTETAQHLPQKTIPCSNPNAPTH